MFKVGDHVITEHGPGVVAAIHSRWPDLVGVDLGKINGLTNNLSMGMLEIDPLPNPTGRWCHVDKVVLSKTHKLKEYFNG